MPSWGSYSFVYGPLVAFAAMGVLIGLLRWTFRRGRSLAEREPRDGSPDQYGLLIPVAAPSTVIEAELTRAHLARHGIRATVATTTRGPRVMVFPDQAPIARALLRESR
ncbi:MAG: hypothetical protein ACRCTR_01460 [Actinomycetota bacterium]